MPANYQHPPGHRTYLALLPLLLLLLGVALLTRDLFPRARANLLYLRLNRAVSSEDTAEVTRVVHAVNDRPMNDREWRGIGLAYLAAGNVEEAAAAWAQFSAAEAEARAWIGRSERDRDLATALEWYHLIALNEPDDGDNWYRLAQVATQAEDDTAAGFYRRALEAPQHTEFGRSNIMVRLAELDKRLTPVDWPAILATYDEALAMGEFVDSEDLALAHLGRAEALERVGQPRLALETYRLVLEDRPGHYWANVHSGRLTWSVEQDASRAAAYLQRAIEADSRPKWAYLNLALLYLEAGQPEQAVDYFQAVVERDPEDTLARAELDRLMGSDGP